MTRKHDLYTAPTPSSLCRVPCLFQICEANCRPVDWQQRALMSLALVQNYLKTFPFKVNNLSRVFFQPAAADNKLLGGASSGMERNGTEQKTNFLSMTVDIYADLFVMTPLSAAAPAPAVGHLLPHSLPSVCSIRLSFPSTSPFLLQPRPAPAHQRIGKEGSALVCCPAFCLMLAP